MKNYVIRVEETLSRQVIIKAPDEEAALQKVVDQYRECTIVLDAEDFSGTSFTVEQ